jgi:hypothetical protein
VLSRSDTAAGQSARAHAQRGLHNSPSALHTSTPTLASPDAWQAAFGSSPALCPGLDSLPCKPPRRAHQQWRQPWERELFVCHSVGVPYTASLRPGIAHASRPTSSHFVGEFIFQKIHAPGMRICAAASPASLMVQGPEPPRSPHPLDRDRSQPGESYL